MIHTIPLEIEALKEYRSDSYAGEREQKIQAEIDVASHADVVACVGPRITRSMKDQRTALRWGGRLVRIDCGMSAGRPRGEQLEQPTVLFVGRTESLRGKGLDLFAHCAGHVEKRWRASPVTRQQPRPRFVVRGGAPGDIERVERELSGLATDARGVKAPDALETTVLGEALWDDLLWDSKLTLEDLRKIAFPRMLDHGYMGWFLNQVLPKSARGLGLDEANLASLIRVDAGTVEQLLASSDAVLQPVFAYELRAVMDQYIRILLR